MMVTLCTSYPSTPTAGQRPRDPIRIYMGAGLDGSVKLYLHQPSSNLHSYLRCLARDLWPNHAISGLDLAPSDPTFTN